MLHQWRAFNEAMGEKACILLGAAIEGGAGLVALSKWSDRVDEGMLAVRDAAEIPWQTRLSLLLRMAEAVGAVTGIAAAGGVRCQSSVPQRERLSTQAFSPGVTAYTLAAEAVLDFSYVATIDGATPSDPLVVLGSSAAGSSKIGGAGRFRCVLSTFWP